jgi:hypothetical protein
LGVLHKKAGSSLAHYRQARKELLLRVQLYPSRESKLSLAQLLLGASIVEVASLILEVEFFFSCSFYQRWAVVWDSLSTSGRFFSDQHL